MLCVQRIVARRPFALKKLALAVRMRALQSVALMSFSGFVVSAELPVDATNAPVYDSSFLQGGGQGVDLSRFSKPGTVTPGVYMLDVVINGKERLSQKVRVIADEGKGEGEVRYCFSTAGAKRWGAKLDELPDQEKVQRVLASDCIEVQDLIPGATFDFDVASLSGALSIPQIYAGRIKRGYVDPTEWDEGITAGFLSYNANAYRYSPDGEKASTSYNANLTAGFNLDGWRLRHNGNFVHSTGGSGTYNAVNTYAQTDVDSMKAQFTIGEYFTPGREFDSVPFTGVQLGSDDSMLPESERGFAPQISGTADTNAKVTVRQGSNVVYETSVAPGPFLIDDLYATGYSGDLDVTVTEADGREKRFVVPYASVVEMLRPGMSRFNMAAGKYRDDGLDDEPLFAQGTYRRGLNNLMTVYGGGIVAEDYASVLGGAAIATPIGAISLDVTQSHAQNVYDLGQDDFRHDYDDGRDIFDQPELNTRVTPLGSKKNLSGQSYRISYSKLLNETGTNLSVAAYRFSSAGYLSFGDFAHLREGDGTSSLRERNRFQVNISQPLGSLGNVSLSGLSRNYWGDAKSSTTFQASYSKGFNWGSMTLSAGRDLQEYSERNTYMLSVSVPLGEGVRRPTFNTSASYDSDNNSTIRSGISGSAGEDGQATYGAFASRYAADGDSNNDYGGNLTYRTRAAQLGGSYSQGEDYKQYSANVSGTVLGYAGGVVLSPNRTETMALIEAKGAEGAPVDGGLGNRLDSDGQALKSGLIPYRVNQVGISPKGLPDDVELETSRQQVVPRRGAIVKLDYATKTGKPLLLRLKDQENHFGADVVNAKGEVVAMVGQGGLIFLRGEQSALTVKWGKQPDQSCQLRYDIPTEDLTPTSQAYQSLDAICLRGKSA
jgi:outer membrane usher protein